MAVKDVFKVNRKTFFNPKAWLGYDLLKVQTQSFWNSLKPLFIPAKPGPAETFEQAVQRLNLSEADILETQKNYFLYAMVFLGLAGIVLVYGFYLLAHFHTILGWVLSLAVTAFCLSQAFRFHFWYFQTKHRKLGCTFEEWKSGKVSLDEGPRS